MTDVLSTTKSRIRLEYLDGLRAAAALFVLIHHAFCMAYPISLGIRPTGWVANLFGWALWGHFGVTVFIALAGYSLALGLAKHDGQLFGGAIGFMKRRAWRIIPPYWAALALTVILVLTYIGQPTGTHWDLSVPTAPRRIVIDALLLQDVVPIKNVAYTFWSIAVEWHIYLLLPAMLLVWRKLTWQYAVLFGVATSLVGLIVGRIMPTIGPFGIASLMFTFYIIFALAVGACIAVYKKASWIAKTPWISIACSLLLAVILLAATQPYDWMVDNYYWIDLLVGVATVCILIAMSSGKAPKLTSALSWKPLARIGVFSYSLYLVHAPLLQVFWQAVVRPFGLDRAGQLAMMWVVGVPLMIALSYCFYLIAERPFVRRKAKPSLPIKA